MCAFVSSSGMVQEEGNACVDSKAQMEALRPHLRDDSKRGTISMVGAVGA